MASMSAVSATSASANAPLMPPIETLASVADALA